MNKDPDLESMGMTPEKAKYFAKNFFKYQKIFRLLCRTCKEKVKRNSQMAHEEYCYVCQTKIKRILGSDVK